MDKSEREKLREEFQHAGMPIVIALLDHIDALELTEKRMDRIVLMYQVQMQQIWLAALDKNMEKIKQLVHESLNSAIDSAQGVKS